MDSLVSVIVPAYNAAAWLPETLDSALAQTWRPIEVIVVDDGSTDDTAAIARRYESRGVRLVSQANRGLSGARNAALAVARGDYIQYLDADDLLSPDKVAAQVRLLQAAPPGSVATGRWGRFRRDVARTRFSPSYHWQDLEPLQYLAHVARTGSAIPVHAWLLPRAIADRVGPFAEELRVMEDHEYFARVALAATGLRHTAEGCAYYRSFHAHSLSKQRQAVASTSMFRAVELATSHLLARGTPQVRQIAADYYQWLIFKLYPDRPELVRIAARRVAELGGSTIQPRMGGKARALARVVGWKLVQRLRVFLWHRGVYLSKDDFISD